FMGIRWVLTALFTGHGVIDPFPAWEIALSIVATSYVFRHVDPDRPARMVIRTALTDWRRTREPDSERRDPRLVPRRVIVRRTLVCPRTTPSSTWTSRSPPPFLPSTAARSPRSNLPARRPRRHRLPTVPLQTVPLQIAPLQTVRPQTDPFQTATLQTVRQK